MIQTQKNIDTVAEELFTGLLRESGMPVTGEEARAAWDGIVADADCKITNNSAWSPFWRLVTAIATAPCLWLVKLLVKDALPNVFLRFAKGAWLDIFAWGVDLSRKQARAAGGTIVFTRSHASGELEIPAGVSIETLPMNGKVYRVVTVTPMTISQGSRSAAVPVQAEQKGAAYNLGPGYYSILSKPVPGIASVRNEADWLHSPGADEEGNEPLRLRCRNQFAAVGQYHHDAGYKAIIGEFAAIRLDYLFFEKEAPRGPGTANCHIMIDSGVPPQTLIDAMNSHIRESGNHGHGDDMRCMAITGKPFDLSATVYAALDATDAERAALLLEVENRVRCAFRENQDYAVTQVMPLSRFSFSQLDRELHAALPALRSIVFDHEDIVSQLTLPVLHTLAVLPGQGA